MYPEHYNENSYVGMVFRLTDVSNYISFEIGKKFCRMRRNVNGTMNVLATNMTCGYKR